MSVETLTQMLLGHALLWALIYAAVLCYRGPSIAKTLIKTLVVFPLAGLSFLHDGPQWLTAALIFCGIGDVALSRDGDRYVLTDMAAFAAGHFAFVLLFLQAGADIQHIAGLGRLVGVAAIALVLGAAFPPILQGAGPFKPFVGHYALVILAMGLASLAMPPSPLGATIAVAALMFIGSDTLLGRQMFVQPVDHPLKTPISIAIWTPYWLALLLFTLTFVF